MSIKLDRPGKLIACFVLFALVYAQFAISAHAVFHPDHDTASVISYEIEPEQNDEWEKHNNHKCPECLIVKSFQTAFADSVSLHLVVQPKPQPFILFSDSLLPNVECASYCPRAPPPFFV